MFMIVDFNTEQCLAKGFPTYDAALTYDLERGHQEELEEKIHDKLCRKGMISGSFCRSWPLLTLIREY